MQCKVAVLLLLLAVAVGGQRCPRACPLNYDPVCGTDGKTYSNDCNLYAERDCENKYGLRIKHKGKCGQVPSCPRSCTEQYDPVCGNDLKTYDNNCFLEDARDCEGKSFLRIKHRGECKQTDCPFICNLQYDPVCGTDGKTYSNSCFLRYTRCDGKPNLTLKHKGECEEIPECPRICTAQYDPVCGTDGKTYGNACTLSSARDCEGNPNLSIKHKGECAQVPRCPRICPLHFDPVCGSDGKTYSNDCSLLSAQLCDRIPNLTFKHKGECKKDSGCTSICTLEYSPVCGSDGKTYGNTCAFESAKKCNKPWLRVSHRGECHS